MKNFIGLIDTMYEIPLLVPSLKGNELKYVEECINDEWVSTAGSYVRKFEEKISDYTQSKYAVACTNGTSALHISLKLAGVVSEDEVIVPTLTFIAPINAVMYCSAIPIFMDADKFHNIDIEKTIDFITTETFFRSGYTYNKKTKKRVSAIIPVHVWGNASYLDELIRICEERNIVVIEDASESLGTTYTQGNFANKHTGTIGRLGCLSFNGNKIITCGGGGIILTSDEEHAERAVYYTTQAKDDPVRYIHNNVGYNYRLTNIQAALGVAQLESLPSYLNKKKIINDYYRSAINDLEHFSFLESPDYSDNNLWLNILEISDDCRLNVDSLINIFEKNKIQTRPVWTLNHMQKPFKDFQNHRIENAYKIVEKSLCMPSSVNLKTSHIDKIVSVLSE